jgi:hypothetical protein
MQFVEQVQRPGAAPAEVRLVVQPGATLLKPPADVVLAPRKSWLQLGRYTTDPFYRQFLPMAAALRTYADPQAFFAQYSGAVTITKSAEEPIDGTRAVRYDLHADLARAPSATQATAAIEQAALQPTTAESLTSVDYAIWLDENNHPIRTLVDDPLARQGPTTWTRVTPVGASPSTSAHQPHYRSPSSKTGNDGNATHGRSPRWVSPPKGSGRQCRGLLTEALAWGGDR